MSQADDLAAITALLRDRELLALARLMHARNAMEGFDLDREIEANQQHLRDAPDLAAQAAFDGWLKVARLRAARLAAEEERMRAAIDAQRRRAATATGKAFAVEELSKQVRKKRSR